MTATTAQRQRVPLVAHVIHALRVGGLENGLVNLINHMDARRYRHAIVCMTDYSEFVNRITRPDVEVIALNKGSLSRVGIYLSLYRCFRALRPAIVHGRNWDGLDAALPAWLAGVPVRIQGEHGRDMHDLDGTNRKMRWLRRINGPLLTHYSTVSRDLAQYLIDQVGVASERVSQIYNGVDTMRYRPCGPGDEAIRARRIGNADEFVVGTVGRLVPVKDQVTLVRACALAAASSEAAKKRLCLVIVGDGQMRARLEEECIKSGLDQRVLFAGNSDDVPDWLRMMDLFVLPSLAEGISNTVLEAMATGLPVIATDVGGNSDLVAAGTTGWIVPPGDTAAIASHISWYLEESGRCMAHGAAARQRVESVFSIPAMVESYAEMYDRLLCKTGWQVVGAERDGHAA